MGGNIDGFYLEYYDRTECELVLIDDIPYYVMLNELF